jgi:copper ion binding protein
MLFGKKEVVTTKISVKGMMCNHCVNHVQEALSKLPGVKKVSVDLKSRRTATLESKEALSEESLKQAIADAGYEYGGKI